MYQIRKWQVFSEEILVNETGKPADGTPVHKIAVAAVLQNPYAGRFSQELDLLVGESSKLGAQFGRHNLAIIEGLI